MRIAITMIEVVTSTPKNSLNTVAPAYRVNPMWMSMAERIAMKAMIVRQCGL